MGQLLLEYAPLIALCISLLALLTSCFSLGWNVYRDVVMKPRLRVGVSVSRLIRGTGELGSPFVTVSATNYGPGQITCEMTTLKKASLLRRLLRRMERSIVVPGFHKSIVREAPRSFEHGG